MKDEISQIIKSYMNGAMSEEARVAFEMWLADQDASVDKDEALKDFWDEISLTSAPAPENPFSIIKEAEEIERTAAICNRKKTTWLWIMSSVAACMAVLAVFGWTFDGHKESCLVSSISSKGEFVLPDGSKVWLNKDSKLYFLDDLKGKTREVVLEGEGYFDVAKDTDHPFIVKASGMSIKALGTRFTVSSYEGRPVRAYLEEGSIMATVQGHEPLILTPDQAAVYDANDGTFESYQENAYDHTAWVDQRLEFVNKSLADIVDCLEHWYCIDISCNDMDSLSEIHLSMTVRQESVEEIFSAISIMTDISYSIDKSGNVRLHSRR